METEEFYFQIARELRLRDIGGIIVVDFIDMLDDCKFFDFLYTSQPFMCLHYLNDSLADRTRIPQQLVLRKVELRKSPPSFSSVQG